MLHAHQSVAKLNKHFQNIKLCVTEQVIKLCVQIQPLDLVRAASGLVDHAMLIQISLNIKHSVLNTIILAVATL